MPKQQASSSKKTMDYQLKGKDREHFLKRCLRSIKSWGLKMPAGEVLVSDFGLAEFENTGLIEFWVANEQKAGYCGKFLFVFEGQSCPAHRHDIKHETFYVLKGSVEMISGGKRRILNEGAVHVMPAGATHSFNGRTDALMLEVSMPCLLKDNFFDDKRIGVNGVI